MNARYPLGLSFLIGVALIAAAALLLSAQTSTHAQQSRVIALPDTPAPSTPTPTAAAPPFTAPTPFVPPDLPPLFAARTPDGSVALYGLDADNAVRLVGTLPERFVWWGQVWEDLVWQLDRAALSPDGRYLAVIGKTQRDNTLPLVSILFLYELASGETSLAFYVESGRLDFDLRWAPDSTAIIASPTGSQGHSSPVETYLYDLAAAPNRTGLANERWLALTNRPGVQEHTLAWHPGSQQIAYGFATRTDDGQNTYLAVIDRAGNERRLLVTSAELLPQDANGTSRGGISEPIWSAASGRWFFHIDDAGTISHWVYSVDVEGDVREEAALQAMLEAELITEPSPTPFPTYYAPHGLYFLEVHRLFAWEGHIYAFITFGYPDSASINHFVGHWRILRFAESGAPAFIYDYHSPDEPRIFAAVPSPGGGQLAVLGGYGGFSGSTGEDTYYGATRLVVIDFATGEERFVAPLPDEASGDNLYRGGPVLRWVDEDRLLLTDHRRYWVYDITTDAREELVLDGLGNMRLLPQQDGYQIAGQ